MRSWDDTVLAAFREETLDRLQHLDRLLVSLEQTPGDQAALSEAAREIHTLKGTANMLGVPSMAELAHQSEDLLLCISEQAEGAEPEVFSALLSAMDMIRSLVTAFADRQEPPKETEAVTDRMAALVRRCKPSGTKREGRAPRSAPEGPPARPSSDGVVDDAEPSSTELQLGSPSNVTMQHREGGRSVDATHRSIHRVRKQPGTAPQAPRSRRKATIRADLAKLDTITNLAGEVAISRIKFESYLQQIASFVKQCESAGKMATRLREELLTSGPTHPGSRWQEIEQQSGRLVGTLADFRTALREFRIRFDGDTMQNELLLDALQQELSTIRMLPLSSVFAKFPRAVRDLAQSHGKDVELVVEGEDTPLDLRVIQSIEPPLVQLLRNAVAHGIETAAQRREAGKPEGGTIRVSARQDGARVVLSVEDDGRGLDPEALKTNAIRQGLLTAAQAESLSDREAPYLICLRGFSTAQTVEGAAGRGVGMDVVRATVEECKGEIEIDSVLGERTTFHIHLPLSLAVTSVLLVRAGGQTFCIPTLSIEMVRMIEPEDVQHVAGRPVVKEGRRSVPLARLATVLGLPSDQGALDGSAAPAVFLTHARQRTALLVEELIGQQEIVIKTLAPVLHNTPNVAGATILGTGQVVVVLHAGDLVSNALSLLGKTVPFIARTPAAAVEHRHKTVMVVEDALTTREMVKQVLEAAGYDVEVAVHGRDALDKASQRPFDLFLVDLQMPVMDGFELLGALRSSAEHGTTPVVILSSLASEEHRRRGLELGADAHLSKAEFSQDVLVGVVERFIGPPMHP